mmetsp:Transcript_7973/g.12487  ORF Transcript_7973/g.12487 Transcript_7973/m.12487 type:complete len:327 (-) Transcript_7973:1144-2124(-)
MGKSTQDLQQKVCQKYGWSYHYNKDTSGQWYVEVVAGMNIDNKYRFTSPNDNSSLQKGNKCLTKKQKDQHDKAEKEIVSAMALEGLAPQIAHEEAKNCSQLSEIFPNPIQIYDSMNRQGVNIWKKFWTNPPQVVGIDTEGNQTSPPVLVQISTPEYTILEAPPKHKTLSSNLTRLLRDNTITKIFCDNGSHADKVALGMDLPSSDLSEYANPPIIDLEVLSGKLFGVTKVARGLAKIVSMSMPELSHVRIAKPRGTSQRFKNIGRFALIEQGKARPLRGVDDLSEREQQYCALDSWCTLQAYLSIRRRMMGEEDGAGMVGVGGAGL